ncbi:hypothetical protein [Candidatus Glomeribacter gigasporarum]|uniref:hypothetical protein n=1 Tax=Candidatus Glomeribacter gigasporarum TaxID=132144 RepID=UPI00031962D8|nr:hypothetical protein [Candidatus Glomeribacter gigasporarum]
MEKKPHKHGSFKNQMRQAASMASPQALANHLSVGTTDPKSYLSKIFPGQKLVQRAVHMNSGQGPSGMTNPLIGMKNLGDYILDAGWGSLGAWAGIKALYEASKSNGGKLAGFVADIASGGTYGIAHGAVGGVLSAIGPFVVMMVVALFFFGAT